MKRSPSLRWLVPALLALAIGGCSPEMISPTGGGSSGTGGRVITITSGDGGSASSSVSGSSTGGGGGATSTSTGAPAIPALCSDPAAPMLAPSSPDPGAWYQRIGGGDDQESMAIAVDSQDNVIVVGDAVDVTDFGAGPVPAVGPRDIFVAKLDPSGKLLWAQRFGGTKVITTGVAIDGQDNIVVNGIYHDTPITVGGSQLDAPESEDVFVVELAPDGSPRWARRLGSPGFDSAGKVGVAPNGDVVVAFADGDMQLVLDRLSSTGELVFERTLGKIGLSGVAFFAPIDVITADAHGDVYLTGNGGDVGDHPPISQYGIYVAKYAAADGAPLWVRRFTGPGFFDSAVGQALVVDGDDVVIGGAAAAATDAGGGAFTAVCGTYNAAFLARLSGADGATIWSRGVSTEGVVGTQLFRGPAATVVMIATFLGTTNLGGDTSTAMGTYLASYDAATGAFVKERYADEIGSMRIGQNGFWGIGSSAVDKTGHAVLETSFFDTGIDGQGSITSDGWGDVLVVRTPL